MKRFLLPVICLLMAAIAFPAHAKPLPVRPSALVTLSVANMRKTPDHRSELVSQAILGTPVAVLRERRGWLLIRTPDGYQGWTEPSSLKQVDEAGMADWRNAPRIMFAATTGWILGADRKTVVSDVTGGAILVKGMEQEGWTGVNLPDGRTGFVETAFTMPFDSVGKKRSVTAEALIATAYGYLGIPYLWGGASAKAADCSGFMQSVFFRNGLILLRDASQQATLGTRIAAGQGFDGLQAGDLLFFGSPAGERVTHVALYTGNLEYIHASGRVFTGSFDPTRSNYSAGRRYSLLFAARFTGNAGGGMWIPEHPWY